MRANRVLKLAVAYTLAAASGVAIAQTPPATGATAELETVVVTGTYIRGTAEDAALPVSVISSEDLAKQGSPSTLEMIKNLSASAGVLGDTNQFDARGAQGTEGSGTINLRGLGPQRTLVLLNGRRMVNNPLTGAVDTNVLPMFAIGRVEVLKDGAAATYGSDAIGGVVNFITKRKLDGLDVSAGYKRIEGSNGDYEAGGAFGWQGTDVDFMVSLGYEHRSELQVIDRDWAHLPYASNPEGGWSGGGNPEGYVLRSAPFASSVASTALVGATTGTLRDPSCSAALGVTNGLTGTGFPQCNWQYTLYDNLVELENRYQAYAEVNVRFGSNVEWHTEALYARTDVPHYKTSPSYLSTQSPTTATTPFAIPGFYYVPASNPGVQAFITAHPTITTIQGLTGASGGPVTVVNGPTGPVVTNGLMTGGVFLATLTFRPYAIGGNPLFNFSSSEAKRLYDTIHFSTDLKVDFSDAVSLDVAATYTSEKIARDARDTIVDRFQLALRGFGGPNCPTPTASQTAGAGVGNCMYYNPFGNAIPANSVTGVANPEYNAAAATGNLNPDLINWFFRKYDFWNKDEMYVVDSVLNGKTGWSLPGGDVGWAAGVQYRAEKYTSHIDDSNNLAINPCVDSYDFPALPCNTSTPSFGAGTLMFLGGAYNTDVTQKVYAGFFEFSLPLLESLQSQIAARYEHYDQGVGATFNPKLALRWQVNDVLAFRGSVGSTFRGPPSQQLTGSFTTLQNINNSFRPVDTFGNANLKPEKALTFNIGALIKSGGFTANIDYWSFRFEDPIVIEPLIGMVNALFPTAASTANCTDPAYAQLVQRFTFTTAGCGIGNIARVRVNYVNGSTTRTQGLDIGAKYTWDQALGGEVTVGTDATKVFKFLQNQMSVAGVLVQPEFDAVGFFNVQTTAFPLPKWRGNFYTNWSMGMNNVRLQANYINGYDDQRTVPFAVGTYQPLQANGPYALTAGKHIPSWTTFDAHYNLQLPSKTTLTLSVENIADRDPPFVRAELNYDTFTANPLGRTFKLTVNQKF